MFRISKSILVLGAIGALVACKESSQQTVDVVSVVTETADESLLTASRHYVGTIEESSATAVSFVSAGIIRSMAVSEGQSVGKGQLLATLDDTQARNMLAAAEADMHQADDALSRMKQLHESNTLPELKWVEVQSQVEKAKAQLEIARKNLADCSIYAPVSGVVGTKIMNVGETALPSEPVLSILNIDKVKVKVSIPEKEIGQIDASTATTFTVEALGGRSYQGGTIEKGISSDALTHTYDIRINAANADRKLLPGMVAKVTVAQDSVQAQSITLPFRCVQQSADGQHFVWTVSQGKAHRSTVTLGDVVQDRIAVLSGLKKGDKVITSGYQKVSEGKEVK